MRKHLFLLCLLLCSTLAFAQTPGLRWLRSLGGTNLDVAKLSFKTTDGGVVLVGSTQSTDKDVSGNHGSEDLWVVKLTPTGVVQWRKCFGGSGKDTPVDAVYRNGGLVIAATSSSNNGDVSGNHGSDDIWILKVDDAGNLVWQNSFGGSAREAAFGITTVNGGGYAVCGYTASTNGNVVGNVYGGNLWIVRITESGTLGWQKPLGGSSSEAIRKARIIESGSGSFLVGTETQSNNGDVSGNNGGYDAWVVKLSAAGTVLWQKCLGGVANEYFTDLKEAADGSVFVLSETSSPGLPAFHGTNYDYSDFYLAKLLSSGVLLQHRCYGSTLSDDPSQLLPQADGGVVFSGLVRRNTGDVVGYHINGQYGYGHGDVWVVKAKADFTIEWQRTLGGYGADGIEGGFTIEDYPLAQGGFIKTTDGGYLFTVYTETRNNGDVTGYHLPASYYDSTISDIWVVKLSGSGTLEWQKTIGGQNGELPLGKALEIEPNEFIVTGQTNSADGDAYGFKGEVDALVFRLGTVSVIKGSVFVDLNSNGTWEPGEPPYSGAKIYSVKSSDTVQSVTYNGGFVNEVDTGSYTTICEVMPPYYTVVPSAKTSVFPAYFQTDSFSFALQPITNRQDLQLNLFPLTPARPGFDAEYRLFYKNKGTTVINNGTVILKKDSRLSFVSSSLIPSYNTGDSLRWDIPTLNPNDSGSVRIWLRVAAPPAVNNGDSLILWSFIEPLTGDETPADDTAYLKQRVVGSFDPNDKTEANGGVVAPSFIQKSSFLQYLIRFQNTGTDTAFTVVVRDTLSSRVAAASLEMIAASHPYTLTLENGVNLVWRFQNINLPDSNVNEPASHGYIVFRIKPKSDVIAGETIHNTASIYFDYNLPVLTNDAATLVKANLAVLPQGLLNFYGNRQNSAVSLSWKTTLDASVRRFEVERSTNGTNFASVGSVSAQTAVQDYTFADNTTGLATPALFYRLKMILANGGSRYSDVVVFKQNVVKGGLEVYPNPVAQQAHIAFECRRAGTAQLQIVNAGGKTVIRQTVPVQRGKNVYPLTRTHHLPAGLYLVRLLVDGEVKTASFNLY